MMNIRIKRAYEEPDGEDGTRILVDRLWPRGLTKEKARVDLWLKEVAPSTELRKWFSHDPAKWSQFQKKYIAELKRHQEALDPLVRALHEGTVTLLYSSHDTEHNNAVCLKDYLEHTFAKK